MKFRFLDDCIVSNNIFLFCRRISAVLNIKFFFNQTIGSLPKSRKDIKY